MKVFFNKILIGALIFAGGFSGKVVHLLFGCQKFYKHTVVKGAVRRKVCKRCGKRYDRVNGKWRYMGRYGKK